MVKFRYFSRKLEELRSRSKVTQVRLAEVAGVCQSTVQAWLAGVSSPNIAQLIALADFFRLPTVDELIRPVPDADEFCVVPKGFLLEVLQDAQKTIRKTEGMLHEPTTGKQKRGSQPRRRKTKRS